MASSDPNEISYFYEPLAKFKPLIGDAFNRIENISNITHLEYEKIYESDY